MSDTTPPKHILVVATDAYLRESRVFLLERQGYKVSSVATDDEAMNLLSTTDFELILIGKNSRLFEKRLDQRIRQEYPQQLTLKVQPDGEEISLYSSRTVDTLPKHVVDVLKEMLGIS